MRPGTAAVFYSLLWLLGNLLVRPCTFGPKHMWELGNGDRKEKLEKVQFASTCQQKLLIEMLMLSNYFDRIR